MPVDRGAVDQQLQDIGEGSHWWDVRELRHLPAVLQEEERILAIGRARIARMRWMRRAWLVVVTDRRLLFLRSGARSSWRQLEVPVREITRVTLRIGPFRGRVRVLAAAEKYRLLLQRHDASKVASALALVDAPANQVASAFGPVRMLRQVVDHMMALPAVALDTARALPPAQPEMDESRRRIEALEEQVQQLQRQVDFLEELLRRRQEGD